MAKKLFESHFRQAAYATNRWNVVPPDGATLEDMLARDFWANVSRRMTPGDIIEVHAPDGRWFAELYVRAAFRNEATVVVLRSIEFDDVDVTLPTVEYIVKYRNPVKRYGVVRKSDNHLMKDEFQTAELAEAWLRDYRKTMAA